LDVAIVKVFVVETFIKYIKKMSLKILIRIVYISDDIRKENKNPEYVDLVNKKYIILVL